MSFIFKCPHCNAMLEQEDSWEGLDSECAACGKEIHIVRPDVPIVRPVGPKKPASPVLSILLLVLVLLVAGAGVGGYFYRDQIYEMMGWETPTARQERLAKEREDAEKALKAAEDKAKQEMLDRMAKAEQDAKAKESREKARKESAAQSINKTITDAENAAKANAAAAEKKRQEAEQKNKAAENAELESRKAKEEAAQYQARLDQRKARNILSPALPATTLPLNWHDSFEVCSQNISGLVNCGNDLYAATIGNDEIYLQFADGKLAAVCFPCDKGTYRSTVVALNTVTGKYGREQGKFVMEWEIDSSSTVVKAQHISLPGVEDYSIWCVSEAYYPIHSQICLDNMIAACADTNNFSMAKDIINSAVSSYSKAFARDQAKELISRLVNAENAWNDNLKRKLSNSQASGLDTRDIDEVISDVISTYKFPGTSATFKAN